MTQGLDAIFGELGLTQYLDAFVDQGFDAWDTILDIQESDLDALGVKLGHRRKLQRRIANARGIAPSISLSPLNAGSDDGKSDGTKIEPPRAESCDGGPTVTKRKYRRHPKPDDNAPERPPSAYVLFSNKMRDDLKSQNLSFTEIAKLVGENWQSLPSSEKEAYETQANVAKEKYHRDLAEYKKTPEYRKYAQYLQEFKEKQAKQNQIHDAAKRPKLETASFRHGSSSSSSLAHSGSSNFTSSGSGSERVADIDMPTTRTHRVNSTASMADSQHSSIAPTSLSQRNSLDDPGVSPRGAHFDPVNSRDMVHRSARHQPSWRDNGRASDPNHHQHLPPLSDVLDDGKMRRRGPPPTDGPPYISGFVAANHRRDSPHGHVPGRVPALQHESSSNGSSHSSGSSVAGYGRSAGDGPLPIHALLSTRSLATSPSYESSLASSTGTAMTSPSEQGKASFGNGTGPRGYGFQSAPSAFEHMKVERSGDGDVVMTQDDVSTNGHVKGSKKGFDGMSALLRAGEIVGRRSSEN